ncbi:hypothetical protein BC938DRAFT_470507, partial [Jimgerdemannia flammicorona]
MAEANGARIPGNLIPYDRLIVLDFEATCDENQTNPAAVQVTKVRLSAWWRKGAVIRRERRDHVCGVFRCSQPSLPSSSFYSINVILSRSTNATVSPLPPKPSTTPPFFFSEFSFVILDASTLEPIHKEQHYVKPERTPLTPFCTQLTGITWDKLEPAGNLRDAIRALDRYVETEINAKGKTFCFVTHGAWDLRIQLPREARDKAIELPQYMAYCRMFDLKQEYQRWQVYHSEVNLRSVSLGEMCETFNLQIVGPQHSGLNDSLTMVNIIRYFVGFGHSDVFVHPIDTNADLQQFKKEQSKVVHLAGLPFEVTQGELEAWFSAAGLRPTTLWMIRTSDHSKPSGSGFVIFGSHDDAMRALQLNGRSLGERSIEVSPSSDRVIEAAGSILAGFPQLQTKSRLRPGDWVCANCSFHNFASRRQCFKCNAEATNAPPQSTPPNFTHGDWMCPNPSCNFHNYASRNQCLKCGNYKPGGGGGMGYQQGSQPFRPGDWICANPSCRFQNFASRTACMRCGAGNPQAQQYGPMGGYGMGGGDGGYGGPPAGTINPVSAPFRAGDWYCPGCNSHNFASRFQCLRCGISKPPQAGGGYSQQPAANMKREC